VSEERDHLLGDAARRGSPEPPRALLDRIERRIRARLQRRRALAGAAACLLLAAAPLALLQPRVPPRTPDDQGPALTESRPARVILADGLVQRLQSDHPQVTIVRVYGALPETEPTPEAPSESDSRS